MTLAGNIGCAVEAQGGHGFWFGEDQARYVVIAKTPGALEAKAKNAGIPLTRLGRTGGKAVILDGAGSLDLAELRAAHENWLPDFMG